MPWNRRGEVSLTTQKPKRATLEDLRNRCAPHFFRRQDLYRCCLYGMGGRPNDPTWILGEHDFPTWAPSELDKFKAPSDRILEIPKPRSVTLETWRRNALNQSLGLSLIYGNVPGSDLPHLQPRRDAIEKLYRLHLRNPNKYTMKFAAESRGQLNSRGGRNSQRVGKPLAPPSTCRTPYH